MRGRVSADGKRFDVPAVQGGKVDAHTRSVAWKPKPEDCPGRAFEIPLRATCLTAAHGIRTHNLSFTKELNQYTERPDNPYIYSVSCASVAFASVRIQSRLSARYRGTVKGKT